MLVLVFLAVAVICGEAVKPLGREFWDNYGREELEYMLKHKNNNNKWAKNVIIFVGDGMGPTTLTAARVMRDGPSSYLSWERFPHMAALKTYAEDYMVTDSSASATSLFGGVKANNEVVGHTGDVKPGDCKTSLNPKTKVSPITNLFQAAGKSTGIVTTARLTHATPGTLYANSAHRDWECGVPLDAVGCKDIGLQMVEDLPGKNINVLLGGGRYQLVHNLTKESDYIDLYCRRMDGKDLIKMWAEEKASRNLKYAVVNTTGELRSVNPDETDYLLGVFAKNHLKFHYERDESDEGSPSLEQMTATALKILMKNEKGFFLMVEAEHVDLAHHFGTAKKALSEVLALHDAISTTLKMLEEAGILDETLIIVTSDHAHTLTMSGYPWRDENILGLATPKDIYGVPYTTLMYGQAGIKNYHYSVVDGKVSRDNPGLVDTTDWDYHQQAPVANIKAFHGGNDVMLYARGPQAHLFSHLHESNYVYWVMKYAARLGEFSGDTSEVSGSTSLSALSSSSLFAIVLIVICNFA